jgi:anti-sigma factor RsiW
VVICLGLGAAVGWYGEAFLSPSRPSGLAELVREAVASYVVFAADQRRPVELWSTQRDDLARWLSNRLNRPIAPPDLAPVGYRLMGGRLVATDLGPAGMFMYDNDQGRRITIFVRPMRTGEQLAIRAVNAAGVEGYAWVSNGVGYTVVGPTAVGDLQRVSEHVKSEIDGPG